MKELKLVALLCALLPLNLIAQPATPNPIREPENIFVSNFQLILSISVLLFGLVVVVVEYLLIKSKKINADGVQKILLVTLIITGALFLIAAGYNSEQISPGLGLLGTVAGYLLGRTDTDRRPAENEAVRANNPEQ